MVPQSDCAEEFAYDCEPVRRSSTRIQRLKAKVKAPPVVEKKKSAPPSKKRKVVGVMVADGMPPPPTEAEAAVKTVDTADLDHTIANSDDKSASARVTDTIRNFNKHYLHFVQEEEKRCAKVDVDQEKKTKNEKKTKKKKKTAKPVENKANDEETKKSSKRPDLKAITKMKLEKAILFPERRPGQIPGIEVGHQFYSRAEMVAIGFHNHWLNGIDYIGQSGAAGLMGQDPQYKDCKFPITISIVMSGQYEDDLDNCENVIYTGQGGNNLLGNKRQIKDQVMERGNLGLKHCMEHNVPVRVTRGHKCTNSYVGKVYTYDGLYKVDKYWAEKGVSGFTVYKFGLKRVEGQPPLTTDQVHFAGGGKIPSTVAELRGLVLADISGGQERIPIPATNLVDDAPLAPEGFTYIKNMKLAENVKLPPVASGCKCKGSCTDPWTCACAKLNGSDFPYVRRDGGRLIEPKAVVFECGPNCGCGPECINRTSQKGIRYRLEVFRTPKKGWGVRSWDFIPSGATVCEYIGVLMKSDDIDPNAETNYVFDIDCLQTMKGLDGREKRLKDVSLPSGMEKEDDDSEFCIDAANTGNVTRFINHSCQPNLFVQCILSTHHDIKQARIVLIAADNIPPLKELTYDYGYAIDSVVGPDGKIIQMACYCGAVDCRKRLM